MGGGGSVQSLGRTRKAGRRGENDVKRRKATTLSRANVNQHSLNFRSSNDVCILEIVSYSSQSFSAHPLDRTQTLARPKKYRHHGKRVALIIKPYTPYGSVYVICDRLLAFLIDATTGVPASVR